jgi:hypothetical protein
LESGDKEIILYVAASPVVFSAFWRIKELIFSICRAEELNNLHSPLSKDFGFNGFTEKCGKIPIWVHLKILDTLERERDPFV